MLKKKTTFLKIFLLMITILFSITIHSYAASISNVTGLKADISENSVYLTWNSVYDASGYDVYFNVPGRGYINLGSVPSTYAKVTGFTPGYNYQSKVRAFKDINGSRIYSSEYSNEVSVMLPTLQNDIPSDVKNLKVTVSNKQAKLTWDKVDNASGYDVYFNVPGQGYISIGSVETTSVVVSGFTPEYTYYAKILAYKNLNGKKVYANNYSNEISVRIENEVDYSKPDKATNLTAYVNKDYVAVDWHKATNATGYDVYLYTPGYGYKKLTSTSNIYYDIPVNTLEANKTYSVKVLAYRYVNGQTIYANSYSNEASFTIEKSDTTKPDSVSYLNVYKFDNNSIQLNWGSAKNATGYEVYVTVPGKGTYKMKDCYTTYTTLYKFSSGYTYYVKVLAFRDVNGERKYADNYSKEVPVYFEAKNSKPSAITGLTVTVKGTVATFNWDKVDGADGYELVMKIPDSIVGSTRLYSSTNSRTVSGLTTYGKSYTTSVYAYKIVNGEKVYGEPQTINVYRNNL